VERTCRRKEYYGRKEHAYSKRKEGARTLEKHTDFEDSLSTERLTLGRKETPQH
jgi:hypothetical protein